MDTAQRTATHADLRITREHSPAGIRRDRFTCDCGELIYLGYITEGTNRQNVLDQAAMYHAEHRLEQRHAAAAAATISPTDADFYRHHTDDALVDIVARYDMQAAAMVTTAPDLATEAFAIGTAAWAEMTRRRIEAEVPAAS